MIKRKELSNIFKSLNKLKFIYGYLRVAHLGAKLGFQKVQKVEKCLIEGAIFSKFWPSHCFKSNFFCIQTI
jgi:hypothetical protein